MYRETPDGKRLAVTNLGGGVAVIAIGTPNDQWTAGALTWTSARGLTRNDLMIFADQILEVARELPFDAEPDAPCCPDPGCPGNPCTFPGYAANH